MIMSGSDFDQKPSTEPRNEAQSGPTKGQKCIIVIRILAVAPFAGHLIFLYLLIMSRANNADLVPKRAYRGLQPIQSASLYLRTNRATE